MHYLGKRASNNRHAGLSLLLACCTAACSSTNPILPGNNDGSAGDAGGSDGGAPTGPGFVNPFVGTGGNGFNVGSAFPGATAPNGLASPSPDTIGALWGDASFLHCSGYWYGDETIQGFSNLHMYGTGVPDYGVFTLMPIPSFDPSRTVKTGYQSKYDKKSETATPGYYAVTLQNGGIRAELTATPHAAYHRYTFSPSAGSGHVVFDLAHVLDHGTVKGGSIALFPSEKRLRGSFRSFGDMSGGWGYAVHFEARTNATWKSQRAWADGAAPSDLTMVKGDQVGADLEFDVSDGKPIEIIIGISMVSEENAAASLAAEIPTFDFEGTRASTSTAWDAILQLARITGGTTDQQTIFLSALYHAFVMPSDETDLDGSYAGFDQQVHQAVGFHYVSNLSLWDTYRTLNPLYVLLSPSRANDVANSLVEMAKQSQRFPKWPLADGDANSMVGAGSEVVLADSYLKGVTGFDAPGAYAILRAAAMSSTEPPGGRGGREDVVPYMQSGYIPSTDGGKVSVTLEYAQDDFALGNLAAALGNQTDATALLTRSLGYRKLFDPATGFLRGRLANGNLAAPNNFDPVNSQNDYVEANAWQSLWVAHDMEGMISLFGSRQAFIDKLEQLFDLSKMEWDAISPTDVGQHATPRKYYWAGNEPDIHAVYMFAQAGRPDLTQKWVKWIMANFYNRGDDGIPGNDDGGTMSAWYIWSALGFYPLPGSDRYIVGAPLFAHAEIAVKGGTFTIDAAGVSETNLYVQSVQLNGQPLTTAELHHADLKAGGTLQFTMGAAPSDWAKVQ